MLAAPISVGNGLLLNASLTSQNANSPPVDKIPKTMKRLIRLAVSAFYGVEHGIIIDYLIHYPCLREDHLCELLKFERKFLRLSLVPLKADKFVKSQMRVITTSSASTTTEPTLNELVQAPLDTDPSAYKSHQTSHNYYYIDYHSAINVARYKLDKIAEALEKEESKATTHSTFVCTAPAIECGTTYTDLDVDRLFDPSTGELYCDKCGSLVVLLGESTLNQPTTNAQDLTSVEDDIKSSNISTKRDIRKMITLFNTQVAPLYSLLKKVENVQLAPHLIKPEPVDIDFNNLANANSYSAYMTPAMGDSSLNDNSQHRWKHSSQKYTTEYEWYKSGGITINIQSSNNISEPSFGNEKFSSGPTSESCHSKHIGKPAIPEWLAPDSSNVIKAYEKRTLSSTLTPNTSFYPNGSADEDSRGPLTTSEMGKYQQPDAEHASKKRTNDGSEKPHKKYRANFKNQLARLDEAGEDQLNGTNSTSTNQDSTLAPWYDYTSSKKQLNLQEDITQTLLMYETRQAKTSTLDANIENNKPVINIDKPQLNKPFVGSNNNPPSKPNASNYSTSLDINTLADNTTKDHIMHKNNVGDIVPSHISDNTIPHYLASAEIVDLNATPSLDESLSQITQNYDSIYHNDNETDQQPFYGIGSHIPPKIALNQAHSDHFYTQDNALHYQTNDSCYGTDISIQYLGNNSNLELSHQFHPDPTYHDADSNGNTAVNHGENDDEIVEIASVFPSRIYSDNVPPSEIPFENSLENSFPQINHSSMNVDITFPESPSFQHLPSHDLQTHQSLSSAFKSNNEMPPELNQSASSPNAYESPAVLQPQGEEFVMVGSQKVSLDDIDTRWLDRMTAAEKEIYYNLSRQKFELLYQF